MNSTRSAPWSMIVPSIVAGILVGCGSSPTTSVPASNTAANGNSTVQTAPAGMPAMQGTSSQAPGAGSHGGAVSNSKGGTNSTPGMEEMMKKNQESMSHGAPGMAGSPSAHGAAGGAMAPAGSAPGMTGGNASGGHAGMADMMKKNQAGMAHGGSSNPGAGNAGAGHAGMADMMKKNQPGMAPGAPPGAGGAHGGMADMMKKNQLGPAGAPGAKMGASGQMNNMGRPGATGGQSQNFTPGSIEEVIFNFCTALADDDTAIASDYISPKVGGMLGKMRDGDLSEDKIEELVNVVSPIAELQANPEQPGGNKRSLYNGKNQGMSFTLKKEKDGYKITEFTFTKAKK